MDIAISHRTTYQFDQPIDYGLQRLRLTPFSGPTQRVSEWDIDLHGAQWQVDYVDHLGNNVTLVRIDEGAEEVTVVARGSVVTTDHDGIIGAHRGVVPLWLYLRSTELTEPGALVAALVEGVRPVNDPVERLHTLSQAVRDQVRYEIGGTEPTTTAESALEAGVGVCQDHAHIFLAAARLLEVPARYVSGYLLVEGESSATASHAWAEAHIDGLGWVGFDISNGISADQRYVRLATGRDYREAAPLVGMRFGSGDEALTVDLDVASQQHQ